MTARFKFRGVAWSCPGFVGLADEGASGRYWYRHARESIIDYAEMVGYSAAYVADVLAILSPRVTVEQNVALAREYIERGVTDRCMAQRAAALEHYERTGEVKGPKIEAFARALQGDRSAVVLDVWMYRAAGDLAPNIGNHKKVRGRVLAASDVLGWPPAETQAAVWTGIRKLVGFPTSGKLRMLS